MKIELLIIGIVGASLWVFLVTMFWVLARSADLGDRLDARYAREELERWKAGEEEES